MKQLRAFIAAIGLAALAGCATAPGAAPRAPVWLGAWASSQQIPEPHNALPADALNDATLRQTVRVSVGGDQVRVRIANTFGTAPLHVKAAQLARAAAAGDDAIVAGSGAALSFAGRADAIIPPGADYYSDPIAFPVRAFEDLAVSLYFETAPAQQTSHPGSRTTSYVLNGNHVAAEALEGATAIDHWYQLSAVDVTTAPGGAAVVVLGDSITDGRGSTTNGNDRWPDLLAQRLQADPATRHVSVLNHGVGGNRLLEGGLGVIATARFDRDVIAQTGVRHLIIFEGVNDLGALSREESIGAERREAFARQMIGAYQQMIARARAHGIRVYGATIAPYGGGTIYRVDADTEYVRATVNDWIRHSGAFDAVLDFDAVLRDPAHPDQLLPAYDTGDRLHPSVAGFQAMADSIPLSLFAE